MCLRRGGEGRGGKLCALICDCGGNGVFMYVFVRERVGCGWGIVCMCVYLFVFRRGRLMK